MLSTDVSRSSPVRAAGSGESTPLFFAAEGAKVVINDLGAANDGSGADMTPAEEVAAEIRAQGGEAIANG